MKSLSEKFEVLDELIRKVNDLINPIPVEDELEWLQNRDMSKKLFEEHPKCFIAMNFGQQNFTLPICNRMGMEDPKIIDFSIALVNKVAGRDYADQEQIVVILRRLNMLKKKFSSDSPKPEDMAGRKAIVTKKLRQLKSMMRSGE